MANALPEGTIRIRLVTAHDCHLCNHAHDVLARLRDDYPLVIDEVALESPEGRTLATRHGILFPPGLFVNDAFVGFGRVSERRLRAQLLGLL